MVLSNMSLEELVREAEHTENELALMIAQVAKKEVQEAYERGWDDGYRGDF